MEAQNNEIPVFDTLRLANNDYIRQILSMNDEQLALHNEKKGKGVLGGFFRSKTLII